MTKEKSYEFYLQDMDQFADLPQETFKEYIQNKKPVRRDKLRTYQKAKKMMEIMDDYFGEE